MAGMLKPCWWRRRRDPRCRKGDGDGQPRRLMMMLLVVLVSLNGDGGRARRTLLWKVLMGEY